MTVTETSNTGMLLGAQPAENTPVDDLDTTGFVDYFGFDDIKTFYLPDGKQYIQYKPLTEGGRAKYESKTSRDVSFNRRSDDAKIKMDPASDRHALIVASVVGWNLVRRQGDKWVPVAFSSGSPGSSLEQWLDKADPRIVNNLVTDIRKANPWMTEDWTVEMIDEEIQRLQEMRVEVAEREAAGKSS